MQWPCCRIQMLLCARGVTWMTLTRRMNNGCCSICLCASVPGSWTRSVLCDACFFLFYQGSVLFVVTFVFNFCFSYLVWMHTHALLHACTCTHMHACSHTPIQSHTQAHTHAHTNTHTYTAETRFMVILHLLHETGSHHTCCADVMLQAQELCQSCGQAWRAATLEGWRLFHDVNRQRLHATLTPITGNPHRDVWKCVCWRMASEVGAHCCVAAVVVMGLFGRVHLWLYSLYAYVLWVCLCVGGWVGGMHPHKCLHECMCACIRAGTCTCNECACLCLCAKVWSSNFRCVSV